MSCTLCFLENLSLIGKTDVCRFIRSCKMYVLHRTNAIAACVNVTLKVMYYIGHCATVDVGTHRMLDIFKFKMEIVILKNC